MNWRYYFPEDGETADNSRELKIAGIYSAQFAAELACEKDYNSHDGWERVSAPFLIVVISPNGHETQFKAWHEPSVEHHTQRITE